MKKKLFILFLTLCFLLAVFTLSVSAAEVVPEEEGSNIFGVNLGTNINGQFALAWDSSFSSLDTKINTTPFYQLSLSTQDNGDLETGYTSDLYDNTYHYYDYYNINSTNAVGAVTLCYYNPIVFANDVQFLFMDASYFDILTTNLDISQIRFSLRNVDNDYGNTVVSATNWFTPSIYSELNNVRLYRGIENNDWLGYKFNNRLDYIIPSGTYYFCVDIRFNTLLSGVDYSLGVGVTENQIAYNLYGIYKTVYEDDFEIVYPPGWFDPVYPDPNTPNLDSDEDVLNQLEPHTNNVLSVLTGLYNSFENFLVPLGSAFSKISLCYADILLNMPLVGNLVEISLYIGLVAFILGSSVITTIFIRRGK